VSSVSYILRRYVAADGTKSGLLLPLTVAYQLDVEDGAIAAQWQSHAARRHRLDTAFPCTAKAAAAGPDDPTDIDRAREFRFRLFERPGHDRRDSTGHCRLTDTL
jgi:hypothetical protein